jgi:hypothetical protein
MLRLPGRAILLLLFAVGIAPEIQSQKPAETRPPLVVKNSPIKLVDQFGTMNSEERSSRLDMLFAEIAQTPNSIGYVLLYCGKKCRYGEIEAHQRGIEIKIALRRFDRNRIVVLNAGFRETFETELWISADPRVAPKPNSTVNIRLVEFSRSTKQEYEAYECCDDYSDVWKNLKP